MRIEGSGAAMVVVSDKVLRIVAPNGRPATTAALAKLTQQEKGLERQLSEAKADRSGDDASRQAEIRRLETAIKEVQKQMEPLKAQLEELKKQEDKEAEARAVNREAKLTGRNPYTTLMKTDLTTLGEE